MKIVSLEQNSGLRIPIGDNCIVEAGLYLTSGSKIAAYNSDNKSGSIVKASELAGQDNLLFIKTLKVELLKQELTLNQ